MPYLSPSSSTTTANETTTNNNNAPVDLVDASRPSHRRTRSATPSFSTDPNVAFTPLVGLPRRQRQFEKKTLFQIAPDDDEEQDAPTPKSTPPAFDRPEPKIAVSPPHTPPVVSLIPFPSSSGAPAVESSLPFPSFDPPSQEPSRASRSSSISRSGSTPVLLANGKPLKPSLKSSVSSPHITDWRAQHPRSRSEPTTPLAPKTVHFPEKKDELEGVVVFEKTARPRAVSGHGDDTETETEGYDSPSHAGLFGGDGAGARFGAVNNNDNQFGLEIDTTQSSVIPANEPTLFANVHMETLVFPRTRPPTLRGSILVKNVAFAKSVALRFTLDNWQTTSEVVCRHVCTLPTLPSPFPPERATPGVPPIPWDRFSFLVRLEDVERKLAERTIFFAARYQAHGVGEWWDNNGGSNFKLVFKKAPGGSGPSGASKGPSPLRHSEGPNPKKMFPGLDLRPATMSLDSADSTLPPLKLKRPFSPVGALGSLGIGRASPPPKSAPAAPSTTTAPVFAPPPPANSTMTNGIIQPHQRTASSSSIASSGSSGSLRLSNYASPTSPVISSSGHRNSLSMFLNGGGMSLMGGQPVSSPPASGPTISPTSSMLNVPNRDGHSSPLVQRRSPTNSLLTASPASAGPPVTPASPFPATSSDPPSPSHTAMSVTPPATAIPQKTPGPNTSSFGFPTNDSTYAALVEKWCFHQSPPPAGGPSAEGSPSSELSTPGLSAGATAGGPFGAFEAGANGYGSGYGYGHHHVGIGKPVSLKP